MQVRTEQLGDKVNVLERGDEDVTEGDDLASISDGDTNPFGEPLTFSCRRCFSSLSSLYVRFERTGVLKGFMIFFIATDWEVNSSFAELCQGQRDDHQSGSQSPTRRGRRRPCRRVGGRHIST